MSCADKRMERKPHIPVACVEYNKYMGVVDLGEISIVGITMFE